MPQRTATTIQVGVHENKVGFRMTFADGASEVFLFDDATASSLFHQGLAVVEQLRQAKQQELHPVSVAGVADEVHMRIVPQEG